MGSSQSRLEKALGAEFPEGERYYGFSNFGNTCYCNATLQSLFGCVPLRRRLIQYHEQMDERGAPHDHLLGRLAALFHGIMSQKKRTGFLGPRDFVKKLLQENALFEEYVQQDAHEFFNFLINNMAEILQEESTAPGKTVDRKMRTWVHELFQGTLTNEVKCLSCETVTSREESFLDLSVDVVQNSSITHCLNGLSATETMGKEDKFYCNTCCCLQEAQRRTRIKKAPPVLALHQKRFKFLEQYGYYKKLTVRVVFPFELKLRNYSDDAPNPEQLYDLFGVVVHIGSGPNHGHYISYVKSKGRWLQYDDEYVELVDEETVMSTFGVPQGEFGSMQTSYLLFYQARAT